LNQLARIINEKEPEKALKGLKIIISHVKTNGDKNDNSLNTIKYQLEKGNNLDVKYIFPEQGEKIEF
jgi:cAMP phosphodiesterase